jgi:hypothetical protein
MGVVANEAGGRYRGMALDVPFVDVLTTMLDASIPLTANEWGQWGDPREKAAYALPAVVFALRQHRRARLPGHAGHHRFEVHPQNPQPRLLKQAAQILHDGGVAAVPTDSSYALVCRLDDKAAAEQLRRIRQVDDKHHLTLLCRDLSELASYARVDNRQYRC